MYIYEVAVILGCCDECVIILWLLSQSLIRRNWLFPTTVVYYIIVSSPYYFRGCDVIQLGSQILSHEKKVLLQWHSPLQ